MLSPVTLLCLGPLAFWRPPQDLSYFRPKKRQVSVRQRDLGYQEGVGHIEGSDLLGHPGGCPGPGTLLLWAAAEGLDSSMPPHACSVGLEAAAQAMDLCKMLEVLVWFGVPGLSLTPVRVWGQSPSLPKPQFSAQMAGRVE